MESQDRFKQQEPNQEEITPGDAGQAGRAPKIRVLSIWLQRVDGLASECGDLTVSSFLEADAVLRRWAATAPESGEGHKCAFKVKWEDGDVYSGRYNLKRHDATLADLLGRNIRRDLEFHAGEFKSDSTVMDQYTAYLGDVRFRGPILIMIACIFCSKPNTGNSFISCLSMKRFLKELRER